MCFVRCLPRADSAAPDTAVICQPAKGQYAPTATCGIATNATNATAATAATVASNLEHDLSLLL